MAVAGPVITRVAEPLAAWLFGVARRRGAGEAAAAVVAGDGREGRES